MKLEFCPFFPAVVWKIQSGTVHVLRLRCGLWKCPFCAEKMREAWRGHIRKFIEKSGGNWWFLTLTLHKESKNIRHSRDRLQKGIDLLLKRARRIWGKISYVRVFERHSKRNELHAHLIVRGLTPYVENVGKGRKRKKWIPCVERRQRKGFWSIRTWVKTTASEVRLGNIADVQRIKDNDAAVRYPLKYLTKELQGFKIPHLRHVQTSQDFGALHVRKSSGMWRMNVYVTPEMLPPGHLAIMDYDKNTTYDSDYWLTNKQFPPNEDFVKC